MKTMKRLVAIALSVLMIFSSFSMIANAWDARNADGITLSITTKIFRLVDGKWTETEKVKQGEEVRARVYLNTDYYTNTGNLLFFYNNDFYEDSFGSGQNDLIVNPYYKALPYGITGDYVGNDSTSDVENFMIANGKITPDFANKHNFVYISYHFASGANNQKFNGSQWLFEFPLTVKADAADGTGIGDFFALEETTRSTSFKKGRMNVPKGPYDGTNETITSMANWDAVLYYSSQPVTLFDNFVTASFDAGLGAFADKSTEFYAEGDAGDALTVPTPTRSNYKFMGWKLKGADDSTAAEITEFPAVAGEYEAVWKSTTETGEELTFITKIYRLDPETNEWIYTDRVKPGEKVKARLFVDTSYFTNAGNIIMFYDSEFFTDSYVYNEKNDLVPNDSATSSAAVNRVSGEFAKIDGTNYSLQDLVTYGYITQDFADTHTAITARYQFNPSTSKKISGDEWFIEFDLEVLDTASGKGEFFIVENTIKNSGDGVYAYINIPLGEEGGSKEETSSMHLWDVIATVESYPVYIDSKITLDANGGNFGAAGKTSYVIEGTIGETVDYTAVPEAVRDGYTFAGWVDASVENPTEADIVDLPAEMPYNDASYKAFWINNVEITFVIGDTEIKRIVTAGTPFEVPEDPTLEGCFFIDWSTDKSGATLSGLPENYPTEDAVYYAIFEADTYSVTYYVLNPVTHRFEVVNSGSVTYGDTIVTVPGSYVAPEGYALSKAYADVGLTKEFAAGQKMPAEAVNIYFYLEEVIYDAVFMVDGEEYDRIPVMYGSEITPPEAPTKAGYDFAGWDPYVGTMDEAGMVFEAIWTPAEYTVTWVVDGEIYEAFDIIYEGEMEIPSDPDVTGYEFLGWSEDENATEAGTVAATMPADDVTYYAVLKVKQYTISFTETGDSEIGAITQDYGSEIVAPADPVLKGYTFNGWLDAEGNKTSVPATMPAEDVVLEADWVINEYTVTWIFDNGSENQVDTYDYNETIVAPADPTKEGNKFDGWTPAPALTMPAQNLEYTATWAVQSYTATFDANGGEFAGGATTKTDVFEFGEAVTAPEIPQHTGYAFAGWEPALGTMPAADTTYKAVWTVGEAKAYTIEVYTMDTTGAYGQPKTETKTANVGEVVKVTATPGEGFYIDTTEENILEGMITAENTTVLKVHYARNKYTITFNGKEGTVNGEASVTAAYYHGTTVNAPVAERTGYSLTGWSPALSTVAVKDATYDAQWAINKYTISFNADGGSNVLPITQDYGTAIVAPEKPVKEGSTFAGWVDADGNATDVPPTMPADDVVIKATWTVNENNVTYINEGKVYDGPTAVKYGATVPVPTAPVKEGYEFDGWFDKDGKQPADYTSMPDNALEFTAKWTANSNVSYVLEVYEMDTEGAYPDAATSTVTYTDGVVDTTKTAEYTVPEGFTLDTAESVLTGTVPATGTLVLKAYLVRNIYKLNVVVNGETATEEYYYNEAVAPVADPVIDGFVFKGWVDADNNKVKVPSIMPANDVTVYADFEEDAFEAKFDAGDGKFESTDSSIYTTDITFGQDIVPPTEKPVKEGYEFGGWATPADPKTPVTDFGKMDSDGADYIAIWNKTEFDVTFYDYKPAENGPISPDVMYAYATQTKNMGDTVAVAGNPGTFEHYTFLGWSTVEGDADSIVTEITMPAHDLALYAIYAPVKVMLIPKNDTCTTVIDRAGGDVDDYDAATSKWYVYGIKEYIKAPELLEKYIDVSGDGRIELIHVENGLGGTWEYTGTGTVVNVYNRMGTPDNTSDDILVESFHIVIFGDINGDSVAQAIDATYVYDEAAGLTSWANPGSSKYAHYLAKAANVDGNTYVDAIDATYIGDHSIGIVKIDQVTGKLK